MIRTTNFNNSREDMARYAGAEDIRSFCRRYHLDGLEYMRIPDCPEEEIPMELVKGIHLSSFQNWMDLWRGDEEALLREFGNMETAARFYGGTDRDALIRKYREELEFARSRKVKYVVFHISEVTIPESATCRFRYSDREVAEAAAQLINTLLDGEGYDFDFLMENLWWPGMNLMDPEVTRCMIESVHYPAKGIMLDTGHLLHTNPDLTGEREGVDYIHRVLDRHSDLIPWIKGIHLHQSLTGEEMRRMWASHREFSGDYWERFGQIYEYIVSIDRHQPFSDPEVRSVVERIQPDYLTHEFITGSREEHEKFLSTQIGALEGA